MSTDTLSPYKQHEADIAAIWSDVRWKDPFNGLRVAYNTSNEALRAAYTARTWWRTAVRYLDRKETTEALRYLRGGTEKIDEALASSSLSAKARDILPAAREVVQETIERIEAAGRHRDEAFRAALEAEKAKFPINSKRRRAWEDRARLFAATADFCDYFSVDFTPKWGMPVTVLANPLGACVLAADSQDIPKKIVDRLREAQRYCRENEPTEAANAIFFAEHGMRER